MHQCIFSLFGKEKGIHNDMLFCCSNRIYFYIPVPVPNIYFFLFNLTANIFQLHRSHGLLPFSQAAEDA